jgi:hypothetical protein
MQGGRGGTMKNIGIARTSAALAFFSLLFSVSAAADDKPVSLLHTEYVRGYQVDESQVIAGDIAVQNLAFEKKVVVHYRWQTETDESEWLETPARFAGTLPDGRDRWHFETPEIAGATRGANFDVKLEATMAGETYVDDNGGAGYGVGAGYLDSQGHPRVLLGETHVLVSGINYTPRGGGNHTVEVMVKKLGARGSVKIVFTKDNWATAQTVDAHYSYGLTGAVESWSAVFSEVRRLEFAVAYEVDGQTFWDNNNGKNYRTQ